MYMSDMPPRHCAGRVLCTVVNERHSSKSYPRSSKTVRFLNKKKVQLDLSGNLVGHRMASSSDHSRTNSVRRKQDSAIKMKESEAINLALSTETTLLDCLPKCGLSYITKSADYKRVYARYSRKKKAVEK